MAIVDNRDYSFHYDYKRKAPGFTEGFIDLISTNATY